MNVGDFYRSFVLPELFDRLPQVFPEFDWQRKGAKWESGPAMDPAVRDLYGKPGRAFCKAATPFQFGVAGREGVSWTRYVTGAASEPTGEDFRRAVLRICELAGIDTAPITAERVTEADRARFARQAEERRAEAEVRRQAAAKEEQAEAARKIAAARKLVGEAVREAGERDQTPLERYRKRRGRDQAKMPGGKWPGGVVYASMMAGRQRITGLVVPMFDSAGKVTAAQRIPIDELGESRPAVFEKGGEASKRAIVGKPSGSASRIGKGFPDRMLVLCEGRETGEAIHEATGWTVWACISTGGLRTIQISEADRAQIDAVVIGGDLDGSKKDGSRPGQEAARDAANRLRAEYGMPCAVALPAHAWAAPLVTEDELPRGDRKSVDWENVVNEMGGPLAAQRFRLSRTAATIELQARWPWEPEEEHPPFDGDQDGDVFVPTPPGPPVNAPAGADAHAEVAGRDDRSKPRKRREGNGWEKWHAGAQRWIEYDVAGGLWLAPTGPILPASNLEAAHEYLLARHAPEKVGRQGGGLTLIAVGGRPYRHGGTRWIEYPDQPQVVIRGEVRRYFAGHCKAKMTRGSAPVTYYVPANISKSEVDSIASAAIDEAHAITPHDDYLSQFWIRPNIDRDRQMMTEHAAWERRIDRPAEHGLPEPEAVIPVHNGLFDVAAWVKDLTVQILPHTPLFFNTGVIEAEIDAAEVQRIVREHKLAGLAEYARTLCPEWIALLRQAFANPDPSAADATIHELHKLIGYYLTTDTRRHAVNICWMIGPKGCGKSVIMSVIEALLGATNCVSSSLNELDENFHLHSWVGKRLALFADMGSSGRIDKINVVEKIKKISTGDPVNINRKHLDAIGNHRLHTRMLMVANAMPGLPDPSGAIMRRSICFDFRNPVREEDMDSTLSERLRTPKSLAGVLLLSLVGLIAIEDEGIKQPRWSAGPLEDLRDQGSRYPGYIDACLVLNEPVAEGAEPAWTSIQDLNLAYKAYSEAEGASYAPDAARMMAEMKSLLIQSGWVQVAKSKRKGLMGYAGIRLSEDGLAMLGRGKGEGGTPVTYEHSFLP